NLRMTSQKFGRQYLLQIDPQDGGPVIFVSLPITVNITVQRATGSQVNRMKIKNYNLSNKIRARIVQDRFYVRKKKIDFAIGYDTLTTVFTGIINEASSTRQGTEIVTYIDAMIGQFEIMNNQTFQTIEKGKTVKDILEFLIGQFNPEE